tara:strand:+ start:1255 stop:1893 length:639 start_codon:yes stop_codon:yes gene_type:complete
MLKKEDSDFLKDLRKELDDAYFKNQIYRTESEMRYSVLQDGKHPTPASKYWQCVREQIMMYKNLRRESYDYRRLTIEIKMLERAIENEQDNLKKEMLQVDLDEKNWQKIDLERVSTDRVREIEHWSRLKKELDDGSFDTQNVETHRKEAMTLALKHRAASISQGSSQGEILNVLGPLATIDSDYKKLLVDREDAAIGSAKRNQLKNGHKENK